MFARFTLTCLLCGLLSLSALEARDGHRGGGGRGGGGRGGGHRSGAHGGGRGSFGRGGGRNYIRSPSMSRSRARDIRGSRVGPRHQRHVGRPRHRDGVRHRDRIHSHRQMQRRHLEHNRRRWREHAHNIRGRRHARRHDLWKHWHHRNNWRRARWDNVALWLPWAWAAPYYFDYSGSYPYVYSDQPWIPGSSEVNYISVPLNVGYDQQQQVIIESEPYETSEWLPLGNYALTKEDDPEAIPNFYLQLSLSKEGYLKGSMINIVTDTLHQIAGSVDQDTQLAIWKVSGKENAPIMQTGLYNLTQEETPIQLRFPDGTQQRWLLVRLDEMDGVEE